MKIAILMQSYLADYNFGCAHFLRGLIREILGLGHEVCVFSPADSWVLSRALEVKGDAILREAQAHYPCVPTVLYDKSFKDLESTLGAFDVVVVNEWIDDAIALRIGKLGSKRGGARTLYYDTHHRAITAPEELRSAGVELYTRVLVLAECVALAYAARRLASRVVVFREAVDERRFSSTENSAEQKGHVVWIGNHGNGERGSALVQALSATAAAARRRVDCWGVGFPLEVQQVLRSAAVRMRGWLPNIHAPRAALGAAWMLHIPRQPYSNELAGVPNIRPYEAAGLGVPLVVISQAPIGEPFVEHEHYLRFEDVRSYVLGMARLDQQVAQLQEMAQRAHARVMSGHTCSDRARELFRIVEDSR